jgi:hypothetical protein
VESGQVASISTQKRRNFRQFYCCPKEIAKNRPVRRASGRARTSASSVEPRPTPPGVRVSRRLFGLCNPTSMPTGQCWSSFLDGQRRSRGSAPLPAWEHVHVVETLAAGARGSASLGVPRDDVQRRASVNPPGSDGRRRQVLQSNFAADRAVLVIFLRRATPVARERAPTGSGACPRP